MNLYYLRCIESDVPELFALGKALGALEEFTDPETNVTSIKSVVGGSLDVIGPIYSPIVATGAFDANGFPIFIPGEPKKDANGNVYWHANLLTPIDLRATAETMAASNPDIATNLQHINRFFVTDVKGVAVPPAQPVRVFL